MSEWGVFEAVAAIVGLFLAVGTPVLRLNSNITKLNSSLDTLQKNMDAVTKKNTESHRKLWEHNDRQDEKIQENSNRIERIETKMGVYHGNHGE